MTSSTTRRFWVELERLPVAVRRQAREAFAQFQQNPYHPSLHFKLLNDAEQLWSARVGIGYRVLGLRHGDAITWFWIGSHAEYDHKV